MSFEPLEYIRHILEEIEFLVSESTGLSKEEFLQDQVRRRAFIRSLEIIGEATKKLPEQFCLQYPQIQWKQIAGTRDRLIHNYFGVDMDIVWEIVSLKIPELQIQLQYILQKEEN